MAKLTSAITKTVQCEFKLRVLVKFEGKMLFTVQQICCIYIIYTYIIYTYIYYIMRNRKQWKINSKHRDMYHLLLSKVFFLTWLSQVSKVCKRSEEQKKSKILGIWVNIFYLGDVGPIVGRRMSKIFQRFTIESESVL